VNSTLPPSTTTATTVATVPSTTAPPDESLRCANLAPGPIVRYAITPREHRADGEVVDLRVRARPNFEEVWCIDKDKEHRLDFNSNQRNAAGREACWVDDPVWHYEDSDRFVDLAQPIPNTNSFQLPECASTRTARRGTVFVEAEIDGVLSLSLAVGPAATGASRCRSSR
jgi:hypothetical protein